MRRPALTRSTVQALIERFATRFGEAFPGHRCLICHGKDQTLMGKLNGTYGPERVQVLIERFFTHGDQFIIGSGYTIGVFFSVAPRLDLLDAAKPLMTSPQTQRTLEAARQWLERGA